MNPVHRLVWCCLVWAVLGPGCSPSIPETLAPDTILFNGKIVTVDPDFTIAQALAIRDGKLVAVGNNRNIRSLAGQRSDLIDLKGKTVVPGFNDGHGHVTLTWGREEHPLETRMRSVRTMEGVLHLLRQRMESLGPDELVWLDRGLSSPAQLEEKRWPNRLDLDRVSSQRPVLLVAGIAGSTVIVNTRLLSDLGITSRTPQPYQLGLQGEFLTDPVSGEPTGVFQGWAGQALVRRKLQLYPTQIQAANIQRAAREMVKFGITTVGDPNTTVATGQDNLPFIRAYQRLAHRGELLVRVNCIPRIPLLTVPVEEALQYLEDLPYQSGFGNDRLLIRQLKIVVSPSRGRFQLPHQDVTRVIKEVHRAGWQLFIHVRGGEAFDAALEAIEAAYQEFPAGPTRHVVTHAAEPSQRNLEIMASRGMVVDPQPGTLYNLPDDAEETFQEPGRQAYGPIPLRTYLDRGIQVMISSDQQPVGPLFHIFEAVNRLRKSGKPILPEEAITVEEALRATTLTPAYSTFQENIKGSLEPGKLADLVVLGRDILTIPSMEIKDIPVLQTMIGGEFVYTNPNPDPFQKVAYWYPLSGLRTPLEVSPH